MKRLDVRCLTLLLPLAVMACGPQTVDQAERICFERARLAQQPRGEMRLGTGSAGQTRGDFDLTISSDWLAGKDPSAVYESCVMAKSGEAPRRPLYQRSDWKG